MRKQIDHVAYAKKVRKLDVDALRFIIQDARAAIAAMPNGENVGYYSDEIIYASAELKRRNIYA